MTYGRRYGFAAMVGIVFEADDDGNAASGKYGNGNVRPMRPNERLVNGGQRPTSVNQPTNGTGSVSVS